MNKRVNKAALVLEYAETAKSVALGYTRERNLPQAVRDDLIQEAYVALAEAAESWDPLRGPFEQWVRMRVGFHLLDVSRKGGPLTRREHAAGVKPPRMVELIEEYADGVEDVPPDEIAALLEGLPLRERQLLEMRYVEGLTQAETSNRMGVHYSRVSQIEKRALTRLRDKLANPGEWPVRAVRGQHIARKLTERQAECVLLAARGLSLGETAKVMGVCPGAVSDMRRKAANRLGARGFYFMPNLVYIALREGHIT